LISFPCYGIFKKIKGWKKSGESCRVKWPKNMSYGNPSYDTMARGNYWSFLDFMTRHSKESGEDIDLRDSTSNTGSFIGC
jgi:hypothetical protein